MTAGPHDPAVARPGWAEPIVGLSIFAAVGFGGGSQLHRLALSPTVVGLIFTGLSGVAGLLGFAGAFLVRMRHVAAFGVRGTTRRWLLLAVAAGLVAFLAKGLLALVLPAIFHGTKNVQQVYATGGGGGPASLALATFCLAVLTPVGEELLFRGVLMSALLRFSAVIAVGGSAAVLAAMHGLNAVTLTAFVEGLFAAEVFRRSGSVWTAVVVHVVFNLPTVPALVFGASG